jgi:hypothetical protein
MSCNSSVAVLSHTVLPLSPTIFIRPPYLIFPTLATRLLFFLPFSIHTRTHPKVKLGIIRCPSPRSIPYYASYRVLNHVCLCILNFPQSRYVRYIIFMPLLIQSMCHSNKSYIMRTISLFTLFMFTPFWPRPHTRLLIPFFPILGCSLLLSRCSYHTFDPPINRFSSSYHHPTLHCSVTPKHIPTHPPPSAPEIHNLMGTSAMSRRDEKSQ